MARARTPLRWLALVLAGVIAAAGCPGGRPARGALVLSDDFDGTALGPTWGTCHWWGPDGCTILTNDELEWYQPGQVTVGEGVLRLTAEPGSVVAHGRHFPYVSGMVSSGRAGDRRQDRPRFALTYGRVEVRFRIPRGTGTWPALWMLPVSNEELPEIDLLEVRGQAPDLPSMTLHPERGPRQRREVRTADLSRGWHTIALDWAPGLLVWTLDGVERFRVTGAAVPSEPMHLVANLAVGGDAGTPTAATRFPATFLVDRVRVWERA
ncbi:MAG TPA: glycoside hydrolase family 16 protein [Iamia sp.]|nr:glycoside hydrolase family 16 protein [Iamia sp.]